MAYSLCKWEYLYVLNHWDFKICLSSQQNLHNPDGYRAEAQLIMSLCRKILSGLLYQKKESNLFFFWTLWSSSKFGGESTMQRIYITLVCFMLRGWKVLASSKLSILCWPDTVMPHSFRINMEWGVPPWSRWGSGIHLAREQTSDQETHLVKFLSFTVWLWANHFYLLRLSCKQLCCKQKKPNLT